MNDIEFTGQFNRLVSTFGKHAFPPERTALILKAVRDLDVKWFSRLCDRMIGDLRHAPLVTDFREAAYKERQTRFDRETMEASKRWNDADFKGLRNHLDSVGCKSLTEAVAKERYKIRQG